MWPYIVGTSSLHKTTLTFYQIENCLDSATTNFAYCQFKFLELELSSKSYGEVNVKFLFFSNE